MEDGEEVGGCMVVVVGSEWEVSRETLERRGGGMGGDGPTTSSPPVGFDCIKPSLKCLPAAARLHCDTGIDTCV